MRTRQLSLTLLLGAVVGLGSLLAAPAWGETSNDQHFKVSVDPAFPPALLLQGITEGSVTLLIVINKAGNLQDHLVLNASHQLFAKAVSDVLPSWKFFSISENGRSVNAARRLTVDFRGGGAVVSLLPHMAIEGMIPGVARLRERRSAYAVSSLRDLDRLPTPVKIVEPHLLRSEGKSNHGRTVVFHFFIDETGKVRIPTAEDEALQHVDEHLLDAVHNALIQWEFTPPTIRDEPVVTRASQPFQIFKNPADT